MMSLKAFLPQLADIVGSTPSALYERQRALMRLGVLNAVAGRGPGSGAPLSPENVASLIIALSATDNLSDTDERVKKLCDASPLFKSACPLTKATSLRGALAAVLSSAKLAQQLWLFAVDRDEMSAQILYKPRIRVFDSPFAPRSKQQLRSAISTKAFVHPEAFRSTQRALEQTLNQDVDDDDRGDAQ